MVWYRGERMVRKGRTRERRRPGKEEEKSKKGERIERCTREYTDIEASVQGVSGIGSHFVTILFEVNIQ